LHKSVQGLVGIDFVIAHPQGTLVGLIGLEDPLEL
jgi:hypothetical protein